MSYADSKGSGKDINGSKAKTSEIGEAVDLNVNCGALSVEPYATKGKAWKKRRTAREKNNADE